MFGQTWKFFVVVVKKYYLYQDELLIWNSLSTLSLYFLVGKIDKGHKILFESRNAIRKYAILYKNNCDLFMKTSPELNYY